MVLPSRRMLRRIALPFAAAVATPGIALAQERAWEVAVTGPWAHFFGDDLAFTGDLNGDGHPDLLVAYPHVISPGTGAVVGLDGATGATLFTLADPTGSKFGEYVRSLDDDLDGDGVEEFLTTASGSPARTSTILVYSGATRAVLRSIVISHPGQIATTRIGALPDVDGDGDADVGVGLIGQFLVHSSSSGALLRTFASGGSSTFAQAHVVLPDVDGDGSPDLLFNASSQGTQAQGAVHLFSLSTGAKIAEIKGTSPLEFLGMSIAAAGDVDQDGTADFVASADMDQGTFDSHLRYYSGATRQEIARYSGPPGIGDNAVEVGGDVGDVDGDGFVDHRVSVDGGRLYGNGYVNWIVSGRTATQLVNLNGPGEPDPGFTYRVAHGAGHDFDGDGFGDYATAKSGRVALWRGGRCHLSALNNDVELTRHDRFGVAGAPPSVESDDAYDTAAYLNAAGFAPWSAATIVLLAIDGRPAFVPIMTIVCDGNGTWFGPDSRVPNSPHEFELEAWGIDPAGQPLASPRETLRFVR